MRQPILNIIHYHGAPSVGQMGHLNTSTSDHTDKAKAKDMNNHNHNNHNYSHHNNGHTNHNHSANSDGPLSSDTIMMASIEPRPLRPFKSNSEYLYAMKEDLAEWLNRLYGDLDVNVDQFMAKLETGVVLCRHANAVINMGRNGSLTQEEAINHHGPSDTNAINNGTSHNNIFNTNNNNNNSNRNSNNNNSNGVSRGKSTATAKKKTCATKCIYNGFEIDWKNIKTINCRLNANSGTFLARDNVCNFINWCRSIHVLDCLLFETDDLVMRKNERSFVLCLLEVARLGIKVGMPTPLLVQMEQEIDRQIEEDANGSNNGTTMKQHPAVAGQQSQQQHKHQDDDDNCQDQDQADDTGVEHQPEEEMQRAQVITNDLVSLHQRVVELLNMCSCPTQFPMVRIADGKYRVGDKLIIFLRILRNHIMVRVGGGWDTLEHYLDKHDPCRCRPSHRYLSVGRLSSSDRSTPPTPPAASGRHHHHHQQHQMQQSLHVGYDRAPSRQTDRRVSASASLSWIQSSS